MIAYKHDKSYLTLSNEVHVFLKITPNYLAIEG